MFGRPDSIAFIAVFALALLVCRRFVSLRAWQWMAVGVAATLAIGLALAGLAERSERARVRQKVEGFVPTYAQSLLDLGYEKLSLDTPPDDPLYLRLIETVKKWQDVNPAIADIYTFARRPDGMAVLVLDAETDYDHNGVYEGAREARNPIGFEVPDSSKELRRAFGGEFSFIDEIYTDRWGTWVTAYAPMRNAAGRVVAVCGVDFPAADWVAAMRRAHLNVLAQVSLMLVIGMAAAVWVSRARTESDERKRAGEVLTLALARAEAADRAKSEFLASMSHEIRTPMNGVIGMTELLLQEELTSRQRRFATTILSSAETLLGVINDVLDFSKGAAGRLRVQLLPESFWDTVEDAVDQLANQAQRKGLELTCLIADDVPPRLHLDTLRIRQILTNLIGNAIKFTERGQVSVEVRRRAAPPGAAPSWCEIECTVSDSGIGISSEQLTRVFEPFTQADGSTTRRFGGTGLGLAICKQLVAIMGGELRAESTPGVGSKFCFRLPLQLAESPEATESAGPAALAGLRVLVVDDNATSRGILILQLAAWGIDGREVSSGADALIALREAARRDEPIQLAVLDAEMPEMNGLALMREIEGDAAIPALPLILLTPVDSASDEARPKGASIYLAKPVRRSDLLSGVLEALGRAHAAATEAAKAPLRALVPPKILLVEDYLVNQQLALAILEMTGCEAELAANGLAAVEAAQKSPFDLVLMDGELPDMDGIQATRCIRELEARGALPLGDRGRERLPIIAVTAHAMAGDRERYLASGMDDYLAKPFTQDQLTEILRRWLAWAFPPKENA